MRGVEYFMMSQKKETDNDVQYVINYNQLVSHINDCRQLHEDIVKYGKLKERVINGERYQKVTEKDITRLDETFDKLYEEYKQISNTALTLQSLSVLLKQDVHNSLTDLEEE